MLSTDPTTIDQALQEAAQHAAAGEQELAARDQAIRAARDAGASYRVIASAVGLTAAGVQKIVQREGIRPITYYPQVDVNQLSADLAARLDAGQTPMLYSAGGARREITRTRITMIDVNGQLHQGAPYPTWETVVAAVHYLLSQGWTREPITTVTDRQIRDLRAQADADGDVATAAVCDRALGAHAAPDWEARRECERIIAQEDTP